MKRFLCIFLFGFVSCGHLFAQDDIKERFIDKDVIFTLTPKINSHSKKNDIEKGQEQERSKPKPSTQKSSNRKRNKNSGGQFAVRELYADKNESSNPTSNPGQLTTHDGTNQYYMKYHWSYDKIEPEISKDSAYYVNIVKRHGWWIGIGKRLTLKEASHLNCYYKLSKKNRAGNWTYLEAFDGYGNPTTYHNIGTYLANQYDDEDKGLNSDWREKLQTVCKWEIVADASGKEVIQERALDSDGDVVYIYSPVKVGKNEYTGSFTDSWGMPIFMRTDSLGNDAGFANFVHVTRDERGFEILLSFTDRFGYPQKNKDGAYMTRREYDDNGNQIKEASQNIVGDNMIDDYGNCGWENTYKNNHRISSTYFNADWNPMIFPNFRDEGYKVFGFRFEPDEFGRDTAIVVVDAKGNPDVDREYGIHKIINRYNNHGKQIYQAYYGINGNLIAGNKLGIAQVIYDFTQKGLIISIEFKGPDGQYIVSDNGYCKKAFDYNKEDVEISEIEYVTNNTGELVKSFEYTRDVVGNTVRTWYQKNKQRVDSVDAQGRNILLAWYDLKGNPIENEGLHKVITEFDDDNNVEIETWLDKDGDPFVDDDRGYSKDVTIRDNANNIRTTYQYWYGGLLKYAYQQRVDPETKITTRQWDVTPYGEQARVGWYNNLHYACDVDYTMYGKIRIMVGRNEFDEPAYLTSLGTNGEVCHFFNLNHGQRLCYDEFGFEIPDSTMEDFKSHLPRVYCIEVTDTSTAYPLGLRNGDIILTYGDWSTNQDLITDVEYFYLEAILKAKDSKKITLLRHHPETKSSEIVLCKLPAGRTSDLGFYPHKIYYTQKEKERLLNTSKKYGISLSQYQMQKDSTILLAVQTKGGFEQTRLYHFPMYDVKDPGVVLYAKEKYNKGVDTWSMLNNTDKWEKQDMFRIKGANLYITQDLQTTRHIDKQSRGLGGMRFIPLKVSMDVYNSLFQCYQTLGDSITSEKKPIPVVSSSIKIKEKQLLGKWQTNVKEGDFIGTITLVLSKKPIACLEIGCNFVQNNSYGAHFNITIPAEWRLTGNVLRLDLQKNNSKLDITAINVSGKDDEKKDEFLPILKDFLETNKDELIEKLIENVQEDIMIKSVDKNKIIVQGNKDIVFKKMYNTENEKKDVQWIDLGLSSGTLWATKNVGATAPSDYGSYYAWGETATKVSYKWETLKYCIDADGNQFSKYVVDSIHGLIDNKYELEISDDAAYQNMGKSWRIPTYLQLEELVNDCIWTWTTMDDHNGYEIVGPNGQSLFLPANGYRIDDTLNAVDDKGCYLSRTLDEDDSRIIYYHNFTPTEKLKYGRYHRYPGFGIRAVYEGE